jgi:Sec-independent protein translocase protein TatA
MNFGVSGEAIFLSLLLLMLLGSNKLPEIGRPVAVLVRGSRRASNGFRSAAKRALLLAFVGIALTVPSNLAQAQRIDAAVGVGTILAPGASSASSSEYPVSLSGGLYPGLSGDLIFWRNLGIGAEIYWRASQGVNYGGSVGVNFRPFFYNFNAVYSPKLANHTYLELVGGLGGLDTRFYECPDYDCNLGLSSGVNSFAHFDVDFGGGVKFYAKRGIFIRPEARFYFIRNDTNFSSNHAGRVGISIGYTFGSHP